MYKPKKISSSFDGPRGIAKVRISKDGQKVQVLFQESEDSYILKRENCPDELIPGEHSVSLNKDANEMFSFHPANGSFRGKVLEFASQENQDPVPKTSRGQYPFEYFTVRLKIVDPEEYKGITVPLSPRYHFGEDDEGNTGFMYPNSKYTPLVEDFCEYAGVWNRGPVKWKDNILPTLEKRILREGKTFQFVIKDGWVTTLFKDDKADDEEAPWEEDGEEFADAVADDDNYNEDEENWEVDEEDFE